MIYYRYLMIYLLSTCLCINNVYADANGDSQLDSPKNASPYLSQTEPTKVYWGDTHVHTNLSFDASYLSGNTFGPEEAYRFAKGETITTYNGMVAGLSRPLDFLVVADHANNMGVVKAVFNNTHSIRASKVGRHWADRFHQISGDDPLRYKKQFDLMVDIWNKNPIEDDTVYRSTWQEAIALADKHNNPGHFTALIGYEWTAFFNLHRVVIFKDDATKVGQVLPFSAHPAKTNSDPEALWDYMQNYQDQVGGEVLAIPHNGNMSFGVMFATQRADGSPFSADYAATRSRWEPLFEVTQVKGDSETHPMVSPDDEFADFERIKLSTTEASLKYLQGVRDKGYLDYRHWFEKRHKQDPSDKWMRPYEFARPALKLGLELHNELDVNPFKFGLIGSTDSHTALSTADENNFWGKMSPGGPSRNRMMSPWDPHQKREDAGQLADYGWKQNAAGYAAVWARENTREALFAAMKRKEVYASTGPRITVRFFGGWDYQSDDAFSPDLARIGYQKGVPMGGDLTNAPKGKSPRFLIRAVKDPDGANLDRVQVIKGWHDANGELHEKIYDVALSDSRKPNWRGKVKPVGNTVDIPNASYTNSIGDPELAVVWHDPDFNKDELAFYYLRVLEIPTPRWTAYDAKYFKLKDIPAEVPMVTQERAYTSPIWYSPVETRQE